MKQMLIGILALLLSVALAAAQENECSTIVQDAVSTTAEQCSAVASGEACFGHAAIDTIVNCDTIPNFDSPGDTIPLDIICNMRVSAMQLPDEWGMALIRVPGNDSDLNSTFVLFGELELNNAASSFSALEARIVNDTEVHTGPGSHYDRVASLRKDEIVSATACNCTGNWLRVHLETGQVGWVATRNVRVVGDAGTLPSVQANAPVYESMQAFSIHSGSRTAPCADAPEDGLLIQTPAGINETRLQINAVEVALTATAFVQSEPSGALTIEILDGVASVMVDDFTMKVSAGARAIIPMTAASTPDGIPHIEPYTAEDVRNLPLSLLPEPIDPTAPLNTDIPVIVGVEACAVIADRGTTVCPLYYLNPDGDAIVRMDVEFVSAPLGVWQGSIRQSPERIVGDNISGVLAWDSTCSLQGGVNFIGPVMWSITITDDEGHISEPFEAQYNCVEG